MDLVATVITRAIDPVLLQARGPRLLIFYSRGQSDLTNVIGGAKGLVDALVKKGVFLEDDPKNLVFTASLQAPKHPDKNIQATIYIGDVA